MRGLITILMALGHSRNFFGTLGANPTDLTTTTAGLFLTRWITHSCAPGYYTGFGVKTRPGVREAIEQGEWGAIDEQVSRLADALNTEATAVSEMASALGGNDSGR